MVLVTPDADLPHGTGRVVFLTSLSAAEDMFPEGTEARTMAQTFFAQPIRAQRVAVARAFAPAESMAGYMTGSEVGPLTGFASVTDGGFKVTIDGDEQTIGGINASGVTEYSGLAGVIQASLRAVGSGGYTLATVTIDDGIMKVTSGVTGDASSVSALSSPGVGTDISGRVYLNADTGAATMTDGYEPTTLTRELGLIADAAACQKGFIYGWAFAKGYRDNVPVMAEVAAWIQSRRGVGMIVSNSAVAYNPAARTDIGAVLSDGIRPGDVFLFWDDKRDQYVDVALLSYMLHVDYRQENSTVTAKFKKLELVAPASVTESQLGVLRSKGYNVYASVGNTARYVLDGQQVDPSWYLDSVINFDNLEEQVQTSVMNFFLRRKKVAYRQADVMAYYDAIATVFERFVFNGTLAERQVPDTSEKAGYRIEPPYTINIAGLSTMTATDRAARVAPPVEADANEAGAMHSGRITINALV
jgi:hypothetical protein